MKHCLQWLSLQFTNKLWQIRGKERRKKVNKQKENKWREATDDKEKRKKWRVQKRKLTEGGKEKGDSRARKQRDKQERDERRKYKWEWDKTRVEKLERQRRKQLSDFRSTHFNAFWIHALTTVLKCSLNWKQSPLWHFSKYFSAEKTA